MSFLEMDITFKDKGLERVFNSEGALKKRYGEQVNKIKNRMAVLIAAATLEQVPVEKPYRRHPLTGDRRGQFAVDLKHPFRLIFEPDHNPVPTTPDGGIDVKRITAIRILGVEDYH